jgi:hypothetical protein
VTITLRNLTLNTVTLDTFFDDRRILRTTLPPFGHPSGLDRVDLTALATVDEINRNPQITALRTSTPPIVSVVVTENPNDLVLGPTNILRETSGPTDLTLGAVADGQTLIRSGSALIGAAFIAAPTDVSLLTVRRQTADATPSLLTVDGAIPGAGNRITLTNNTTYAFEIRVVARRADADGENAHWRFEGTISRDANAASTALVGSVTKVVADNVGLSAADVSLSADATNGALEISATGEAGKTIQWTAFLRLVFAAG